MAIRARVEPIDRDIELMLSEELSPQAQRKVFAQYAGEQIEDAKATNRNILGRLPRLTVSVDGREGAPLASVKPDGVIVAEFELVNEALLWIADQLEKHSPVKKGVYKASHILLADGVVIDVGQIIPVAEEYVFINTQPYSGKIELGSSSQAPEGVYHAVAVLARQKNKFGNIAQIRFEEFRGFVGGPAGNKSKNRNPAISVKIRGH